MIGKHGDGSFIRAKIRVPISGSDYLVRPRLHEKLADFATRPINLVVAPAGYGKSSLVASWADRAKEDVAWFSLGEEDSSLSRFWTYFIRALVEATSLDFETGFLESDMPENAFSVQLLDELIVSVENYSGSVMFVLEDFHRIGESESICAMLSYLVENGPDNLHLIIVSRSAPPMRLARMRMNGLVGDISQDDLRFTRQEVAALLARERLSTTEAFLESAYESTHGWPAALKLVALSLKSAEQDGPFDELPPDVSSFTSGYLFEEVIDRMPERVKRFALATSCLDTFCPSLAAAVLKDCDGKDAWEAVRLSIDYLVGNNIFITEIASPGEEPWYSYHALLREALRWHAMRLGSETYQSLNGSASEWYAEKGMYDLAVTYAARAADYDGIRDIIFKTWRTMLENDEQSVLMRWFRNLPDEYIERYPKLCLFEIIPLATAGEFSTAERRVECVKGISKQEGDLFDATANALLGILRSVEGNAAGAKEAATLALDQLPEG